MCLLDILEEERALKAELDSVQKKIVDNLYMIDECKDKGLVDEAGARHDQLRTQESELKSRIRANKRLIGGYILRLFEDQII